MRNVVIVRRVVPRAGQILIGVLAAICVACVPDLEPASPHVETDPLPDPQVSSVQLPLTVPLERLRAVAEPQVPQHLADQPWYHLEGGGPDAPACGVGLGYNVDRDPLGLTGAGNAITTSLSLRSWIKARKRIPCPGPLVYLSCGVDGEASRTLSTSFVTTLGIADNWEAQVTTKAGAIVPGTTARSAF